MSTSSVILFISKSGHLIGLAGVTICLLFFYLQVVKLFVPGLGGWRAFRIERLFRLAQRFLWLSWLTGLSLIVALHPSSPAVTEVSILGNKLIIMLMLSFSTIGLDGLVKRLFLSIEGGREFITKLNQSIWFKVSFALSVSGWVSTIYLSFCYYQQQYSPEWIWLIALMVFSVVFALLISINDRWINLRSREEGMVQVR